MSELKIPVSPGEALDRLVILRIKVQKMEDRGTLATPTHSDLARLERSWGSYLDFLKGTSTAAYWFDVVTSIDAAESGLLDVNKELWDLEDAIREYDVRHEGRIRGGNDAEAIAHCALTIATTNDRRAAFKETLNVELNASAYEQKMYATEEE